MTFLFLAAIDLSGGDTEADAVHQIAGRFTAAMPARMAVSIVLENRSTIAASAAGEFRRMVQQALIDGGYTMADSGVPLRLSISENNRGLLAVAQFGGKVVMTQWRQDGNPRPASRPRIVQTPLWSQAEPILDILRSDAAMLVLEPLRVVLYRRAGESWKFERSVALGSSAPAPRDPRGRLKGNVDAFRVSAPGVSCSGSVHADLVLNCGESFENPWVAGRNLQHDPAHGDFYSSAELASGATAIAGVDRKVRIFTGSRLGAFITLEGLGSDVAPIRDSCGVDWLATQEKAGRLETFMGMSANGAPMTEPAPASGVVTSLWPAEQPEEVTAVVYNSSSRQHEAFRLAIRCPE